MRLMRTGGSFLISLLVFGCGAAMPTETPAPTSGPTPTPSGPHDMSLPAEGASLMPGTYSVRTGGVTPAKFTITEAGWVALSGDLASWEIGLDESHTIVVAHEAKALDPLGDGYGSQVAIGPTAADFANWLASLDVLTTTAPTSVTLGGIAGVTLDVGLQWPGNRPIHTFCDPADPCAALFATTLTSADGLGIVASERDRFFVLDGPGGVVVVDVGARKEDWDSFMPAAQAVLDSLQFETD